MIKPLIIIIKSEIRSTGLIIYPRISTILLSLTVAKNVNPRNNVLKRGSEI